MIPFFFNRSLQYIFYKAFLFLFQVLIFNCLFYCFGIIIVKVEVYIKCELIGRWSPRHLNSF